MKNTNILLCSFIFTSLLSNAEEYTMDTVTRNNWKTIKINDDLDIVKKNGGEIAESNEKIKYKYTYPDGTVLGSRMNRDFYVYNYGKAIRIIDSQNMTVEGDYRTKPITETTIASDGTIHFIHLDDVGWVTRGKGVYVYNSNASSVERSETIFNFDSNVDFDIKTHVSSIGPLYDVINVVAKGKPNEISKPVSTVNFLKKVKMNSIIKTHRDPRSLDSISYFNLYSSQTNDGGETHLKFNDDVKLEAKSIARDLDITAFSFDNKNDETSSINKIDPTEGSSVSFDGNVDSIISTDADTRVTFLDNSNENGHLKINSKKDKTFKSTVTNSLKSEWSSSYADTTNIRTYTKKKGVSEFEFNANTDLTTSSFNGDAKGIYMDAQSQGKNLLKISGDKNSISTTGKEKAYGIITRLHGGGENEVIVENTDMTTVSTDQEARYAAYSIAILEENQGKTSLELNKTNLTTKSTYAYGIYLSSLIDGDSNENAESSINWKGKNTIHSEATSTGYGIRIEKKKVNLGKGTTLLSDAGSSIEIELKSYYEHEHGIGIGISQIHSNTRNKTNTTFNGDVSIAMPGNWRSRIGVIATTDSEATSDTSSDTSSNTIIFNKKLNIDARGNQWHSAISVVGSNTSVTVSGKDTTTIVGNVFAANGGTADINLLTKDSNFIGKADNGVKATLALHRGDYYWETIDKSNINSRGTINVKVDGGNNYWEMTENSIINKLDVSNAGEVRFGGTEVPKVPLSLTVDTLTGTGGVFRMAGNVQTRKTDMLTINSRSEGEHGIHFRNMADSKSTGTEVLKLVESLGTPEHHKAVFSLHNEGSHVGIPTDDKKPSHPKAVIEKGAYLYTLGRAIDSKIVSIDDTNVNNWYLYPYYRESETKPDNKPETKPDNKPNIKPVLTPGAETSLSFNSVIYQLNLLNTETLVQRLGEIHFDKTDLKPHNAWIKHVNGKYTSFANDTIGSFNTHYWGIKAGFDWLNLRNNWINYNGISVENLNASTYPKRFEGKTKISGKGIGIYSTWLNKNNDIYIDLVGKMMRYKGKYDIVNYSNENIKSNNANINSYLLSIETGKRSYLLQKKEKAFYIQPEMQLIYQFVDDYTLRSSNGLKSMTKNSNSLIGRIGFRAGLDFYGDSVLSPYIKLMYNKEFLGSVVNDLNTARIEMNNKDDWFNYGVGISHENKKKGRQIYLDVQRSNKHLIRQNWQVNLGLRYSF